MGFFVGWIEPWAGMFSGSLRPILIFYWEKQEQV
jgi:hypothetical protein